MLALTAAPIVYISQVLKQTKRNYMMMKKECSPLLWAIIKPRPYIEGYDFSVITDQKSLQ